MAQGETIARSSRFLQSRLFIFFSAARVLCIYRCTGIVALNLRFSDLSAEDRVGTRRLSWRSVLSSATVLLLLLLIAERKCLAPILKLSGGRLCNRRAVGFQVISRYLFQCRHPGFSTFNCFPDEAGVQGRSRLTALATIMLCFFCVFSQDCAAEKDASGIGYE